MQAFLLTGGTLFDTEAKRLVPSAILVRDDKIEAVRPEIQGDFEVVDIKGLIASPGFIDVHGHSDGMPMLDCDGGSKLCDGVTTEIAGNCGSSIFPDDEQYGRGKRYCSFTGMPYELGAADLGEYLDEIEKRGMPLNLGFLVGHGKLRAAAAGRSDRPLTRDERQAMRMTLAGLLDQGGLGLSLGFAYPPGCYADTDEIVPLAEEIAARGLIVTSHIRDEGAGLMSSLEEFFAVAERTNCRLQISHLKAMWPPHWPVMDRALALIRERIDRGFDITADRYTYTASSTNLDYLLPRSWYEGGNAAEIERLKDPARRAELGEHICAKYGRDVFDSVQVVDLPGVKEWKPYCGQRVSAIAEHMGRDPLDAYAEMNIRTATHASAVYHGMSEENLEKVLAEPYVCAASDATYRSVTGIASGGVPHPRAFGTFSRYLGRYVRDRKVLPLEEALYRITRFAAERFGIRERGVLKPGFKADITVFDPAKINDNATFEKPHQYSTGIAYVFVNGRMAVKNGEVTGVKAGEAVRSK